MVPPRQPRAPRSRRRPACSPGAYSCTSQVETAYESNGGKQFVASGGQGGALTLLQQGTTLTAPYSSDSALVGTLQFDLATETTATASAGQSVTTPCEVPVSTTSGVPETPGTLSVSAASVTALGSTLFLSFAGTMAASSACAGARKAGSVICERQ
jgi:hypothetical protein